MTSVTCLIGGEDEVCVLGAEGGGSSVACIWWIIKTLLLHFAFWFQL